MLSNLYPRGSRLVVRLDKRPRTFAGGKLVIGEVKARSSSRDEGFYRIYNPSGIVVMTGPDVADIEVDDRVLITQFNGVPLSKEFGKDLLLIKEEFVMARVGHDAHILVIKSVPEGAGGLRK